MIESMGSLENSSKQQSLKSSKKTQKVLDLDSVYETSNSSLVKESKPTPEVRLNSKNVATDYMEIVPASSKQGE